MIQGRNIICFASGWDYHPTSKHHVMRGLSAHNHIIWVNWHSSRRPTAGSGDLKSIASKLREIGCGARRVAENITVITPMQFPFPGLPAAREFNALLVRRAIRKVLATLPRRPVQLWSFAPDVAELVGSFDEELVLYYCVDAFGEFPGYDRALIERRERELLDRADLVIAVSPPLYQTQRRRHHNVHYLPHGVDHAHLSTAVTQPLAMPPELADLARPILGFVGVVGDWVDLDLIAGLARRRPDAAVVIIGPELTGRGAAGGLPNVHWLGPRPHALLPGYLRYFDVALIPFKQVALTYNANPIKLFEYLAAGAPVVSTPLPAVRSMKGHVWVAGDADALADACDAARQVNTQADRHRRSLLMTRESWSARIEKLSTLVEDTLDGHATTPEPAFTTDATAAAAAAGWTTAAAG